MQQQKLIIYIKEGENGDPKKITEEIVNKATQLKKELAPYIVNSKKFLRMGIDMKKTKKRKDNIKNLQAYDEWVKDKEGDAAIPTKQDVENWEKKEKEKGNDKKKSPVKVTPSEVNPSEAATKGGGTLITINLMKLLL